MRAAVTVAATSSEVAFFDQIEGDLEAKNP